MPDPTPVPARGQESALLVVVPAAEPAVGEHRARLDPSARDGVPAHLTVLYPFLPPALIDDAVLASLTALFAAFPAFAFTLDRVSWFGDDVVWLGPRDARPFRALTRLAWEAFPPAPPTAASTPTSIPHLTIGQRGGRSRPPRGGAGGATAPAHRGHGDRGHPDGRPVPGQSWHRARPVARPGRLPLGYPDGEDAARVLWLLMRVRAGLRVGRSARPCRRRLLLPRVSLGRSEAV